MSSPLVIDLPHSLGTEEAKRRIDSGLGQLADHLPNAGTAETSWSGNQLNLRAAAMGQEVNAQIDVRERLVRLEVLLPPALSFFKGPVEAALRRSGTALLTDGTDRTRR